MTSRIPNTADNFVMLRRGLREHVVSGRISLLESAIFQDLIMEADPKTGTLYTNATIISSELRQPRRTVQDALCRLKKLRYIHYDDVRGIRGPHEIFIDKFPCMIFKRNWKDNGVWFSRIWDDLGQFIGRPIFFGRIKVRNIGQFFAMNDGMNGVLSINGFGLSTGFKLDFRSDFDEWSNNLDILGSCNDFCEWLSDFDGDFKTACKGDFKGDPIYISISIYKDYQVRGKTHGEKGNNKIGRRPEHESGDETAKTVLTPGQREVLETLCDSLRTINHGFKPGAFVGQCMKDGVPGDVIVETMRAVEEHKAEIKNGWKYSRKVLKEKMEMHEHNQYKTADTSLLDKLEVID